MRKVPSLNYDKVIRALKRDGWIIVRQRGSHIRLQKTTLTETLKITIPAHRPIKRSTLSHILKQTQIDMGKFFYAFEHFPYVIPANAGIQYAVILNETKNLCF